VKAFLCSVWILFPTLSAWPAVRLVSGTGTNAGDCMSAPCATIQYAVNQSAAGDTVQLAAGIYTEAGITIAQSLSVAGPGPDVTVVQAAAAPGIATSRVFHVTSINTSFVYRFSGMTIRHGVAPRGAVPDDGGGMYVYGITEITNCLIELNQTADSTAPGATGHGGGIYHGLGSLLLSHSVVRENRTGESTASISGDGGGLYLSYGASEIAFSRVESNRTGNTASTNSFRAGDGGGLQAEGLVTIRRSTFDSNQTGPEGYGGGIYFDGGELDLQRVTVSRNRTGEGKDRPTGIAGDGGSGGGIYIDGPASTRTNKLVMTLCTLSGNRTGNGGDSGTSFAGFAGRGGGLYLGESLGVELCSIAHCTIISNHVGLTGSGSVSSFSRPGGGISYDAFSPITSNTLYHTVVSGNTATGGPNDVSGSFESHGYNLITATNGLVYTGTTNGNVLGVDAGLGPLQHHGGETETHDVPLASPARNAGDPAIPSPPAKDQRGAPRVLAAAIDIGAVERIPGGNDFDTDGIPTDWEVYNGMDATDPSDPPLDLDGDGYSGEQEFLADTHAGRADDYFRAEVLAQTGTVQVFFEATTNRVYTLERIRNLDTGTWNPFAGSSGWTFPSNGMNSITDTNDVDQRNYRILVAFPP